MLNEWQTMILDNGLWLLPLAGGIVLAAFPWKHWNAIMDLLESR
jgi:hypothetical protein